MAKESDWELLERRQEYENALAGFSEYQSIPITRGDHRALLAMACKGLAAKELVRVIGSILYNSQAALAVYAESILPAVTAAPEGSDPGGD